MVKRKKRDNVPCLITWTHERKEIKVTKCYTRNRRASHAGPRSENRARGRSLALACWIGIALRACRITRSARLAQK